jgi:hypothetical protein
MTLVVAAVMADGQIILVTVAPFTQGLDVFQRGVGMRHMLATNPTRHHAMQLAGDRFVNFVAGELEPAQRLTSSARPRFWRKHQSL